MVTIKQAKDQIKNIKYYKFFDNTIVCAMQLKNDFVVIGKSSVLDKEKFTDDLSRKKAWQSAIQRVIELEAYSSLEKNINDNNA